MIVTGYTADHMQEIEASTIIDGDVDVDGNLILMTRGGTPINAGNVRGPKGDPGQDAAPGSITPTAGTTPIRTSDGRVKTATPTEDDDATTKLYLANAIQPLASTSYVDTLVKGQEIPNGVNLNDYNTPGVFIQSQNADATTGVNYPVALAGLLEVYSNGTFIWQRYTPYGPSGTQIYMRTHYNGTWYSWQAFSSMYDMYGTSIMKLKRGKVNVTISAAVSGSAAVSYYAPAFTAVPTVTASCSTATQSYIGAPQSVTQTGFSAVAFHKDNTSSTVTVEVSWIAMGI